MTEKRDDFLIRMFFCWKHVLNLIQSVFLLLIRRVPNRKIFYAARFMCWNHIANPVPACCSTLTRWIGLQFDFQGLSRHTKAGFILLQRESAKLINVCACRSVRVCLFFRTGWWILRSIAGRLCFEIVTALSKKGDCFATLAMTKRAIVKVIARIPEPAEGRRGNLIPQRCG